MESEGSIYSEKPCSPSSFVSELQYEDMEIW